MAAFALIIITGVKTCTVFEPWRSKEYLAGKQKRHTSVSVRLICPCFHLDWWTVYVNWESQGYNLQREHGEKNRKSITLAPPGCNAPSRENVPGFLYIAEFIACLFILLEREASEHDARNCPQLGMELPFHRLVRYLYMKPKEWLFKKYLHFTCWLTCLPSFSWFSSVAVAWNNAVKMYTSYTTLVTILVCRYYTIPLPNPLM